MNTDWDPLENSNGGHFPCRPKFHVPTVVLNFTTNQPNLHTENILRFLLHFSFTFHVKCVPYDNLNFNAKFLFHVLHICFSPEINNICFLLDVILKKKKRESTTRLSRENDFRISSHLTYRLSCKPYQGMSHFFL